MKEIKSDNHSVWIGENSLSKLDVSKYSKIGILEQRPLLHNNFINYLTSKDDVKTVLEIGCGMGIYPIKFKNLFENKEYLGLDIGEPAIDFC